MQGENDIQLPELIPLNEQILNCLKPRNIKLKWNLGVIPDYICKVLNLGILDLCQTIEFHCSGSSVLVFFMSGGKVFNSSVGDGTEREKSIGKNSVCHIG